MVRTTRYYNSNGAEFPEGTLGVDLSELHKRLVAHIPAGGLILLTRQSNSQITERSERTHG